ncbi:hypothetical protein NST58_23315 [Paenibacillus sp. FSL R10-2796]|uniref:hypothetical protein n=1 Tax=Paenibacillus sp. FSL R10-2796 TaxID=2954663 RepID=UPI0030D89128
MIQKKRKYKYISLVIIVAILSQMAVVTYPKLKKEAAAETEVQQDKQIAADLSNLTGVTVNRILQLKNTGSSWNEVSETLKKETLVSSDGDKSSRIALLNETGLGEEVLQQLRQEGFQDDEIMEAKLLVERVMQQLNEVKDSKSSTIEVPSAEITLNQSNETELQTAYEKISEQFNESQAVELILKLQQEFGSMESVLDEYMLSLQVGLHLEDYITDKKLYQENKEQKVAGLKDSQIVTAEKLEKVLLEKLQQANERNSEIREVKSPTAAVLPEKEDITALPDINPPTVENLMPQNPGEAIKQEIESINPNHR